MTAITSIMLHDTGTPGQGNAPSLNAVTEGRVGLRGPLAHFLIGRDGTIYQVATLRMRAAHAGQTMPWQGVTVSNATAIGIELEHASPESYPDVQLAAAQALVRGLMDIYSVRTVVGHKEVALPLGRRVDPALDMVLFRRAVGIADRPVKGK